MAKYQFSKEIYNNNLANPLILKFTPAKGIIRLILDYLSVSC